jgi:predicted TPR repeat methyltransferase
MEQDAYGAQLGQAWGLLRQGSASAAADGFGQILKAAPEHLDALFGLGLSQKVAGQSSSAQSNFEKCLELVRAGRKAEPNNDRFLMLERIVQQRIKEISAG